MDQDYPLFLTDHLSGMPQTMSVENNSLIYGEISDWTEKFDICTFWWTLRKFYVEKNECQILLLERKWQIYEVYLSHHLYCIFMYGLCGGGNSNLVHSLSWWPPLNTETQTDKVAQAWNIDSAKQFALSLNMSSKLDLCKIKDSGLFQYPCSLKCGLRSLLPLYIVQCTRPFRNAIFYHLHILSNQIKTTYMTCSVYSMTWNHIQIYIYSKICKTLTCAHWKYTGGRKLNKSKLYIKVSLTIL